MDATQRSARTIAVLLLLQMACGPLVNFGLLGPAIQTQTGFLVNAAQNASQIGIAVFIGVAMGALSVGVAVAAWPVFRRCGEAIALWLFALAVVGFALIAVEHTAVLSMLSLSQAYANANATDAAGFTLLATAVGAAHKWAHYMNLIVADGMIFVFYGALYRFALIPRVLSGFGLVAAIAMLAAIAMPVFGYPIVFALLLPMGLSQLALVAWLLAKGFREPAVA